jgi:CrcB protein
MDARIPATAWFGLVAGGAVGSLLRYVIGLAVARGTTSAFPWGTLAVNLAGCFAIGLVAALGERSGGLTPVVRLTLVVGLLGGFTTFSSFGLETFRMLADGRWAGAAGYVMASNLAGLAAVWAGYRLFETI